MLLGGSSSEPSEESEKLFSILSAIAFSWISRNRFLKASSWIGGFETDGRHISQIRIGSSESQAIFLFFF